MYTGEFFGFLKLFFIFLLSQVVFHFSAVSSCFSFFCCLKLFFIFLLSQVVFHFSRVFSVSTSSSSVAVSVGVEHLACENKHAMMINKTTTGQSYSNNHFSVLLRCEYKL